jgi:hypothetical protein
MYILTVLVPLAADGSQGLKECFQELVKHITELEHKVATAGGGEELLRRLGDLRVDLEAKLKAAITRLEEASLIQDEKFKELQQGLEVLSARVDKVDKGGADGATEGMSKEIEALKAQMDGMRGELYAALAPRDAHVRAIQQQLTVLQTELQAQPPAAHDPAQPTPSAIAMAKLKEELQSVDDGLREQRCVAQEQRNLLDDLAERLDIMCRRIEELGARQEAAAARQAVQGPDGVSPAPASAPQPVGDYVASQDFYQWGARLFAWIEERDTRLRADFMAHHVAKQGTQPLHSNNRQEEEEPLGLETLTITGAGELDVSSGHSTHDNDERSQEPPPTASDLPSDPNMPTQPGQAAEQPQPDTPRRRRQRGPGRRAQAQGSKGKCGGVAWQVLLCALVMVVAALAGAFGPRPSFMGPPTTPANASSWTFASSGRINTTKVSSSSLE